MMPARFNTSIQQKCLGCDRAFCGAYWYSQGVNSSHCNRICNQETFRRISQHHISSLPETLHGGNPFEKDITERCIQQSGKTLQAVISEWITKFDNKELDRSRLQLNNVDTITSRTHLCNHCYDKFIDFLLYWFRVSMPRNLLPPDAADRDSCWYGFMCRTQHHRPDHAKKLTMYVVRQEATPRLVEAHLPMMDAIVQDTTRCLVFLYLPVKEDALIQKKNKGLTLEKKE